MVTARAALSSLTLPWLARWWTLAARFEPLAALVLVTGVAVSIQAVTTNIIGVDGYYHIKVAALMRERGPRLDFPWLQFTILGPGHYTDHHFLFHLLQAPFTVLDLRLAAKTAAAVFAIAAFWSFYRLLVSQRVRWPLLWTVLVLSVGSVFLWRQSMARPQGLFLVLCFLTLWLMFERRERWLPLGGFAAVWLFDGFVLFLALPGALLVAHWLTERRLVWKPLVLVCLGMALGLLLHPYFPRNVEFSILHLAPKLRLAGQEDIPVGREWYPYDLQGYVRRAGVSTLLVAAGLVPPLLRLWRGIRPEPRLLTLLFVAAAFMVLTMRSGRLIEYFPAFAVLFCAVSWGRGPLPLPGGLEGRLASLPRARLLQAVGLLAVSLVLVLGLPQPIDRGRALGLRQTVDRARDLARGGVQPARAEAYRDASLWLAQNTPPGARVYNVDWDDFPQLFFWNHHNTYIVGLDPTYLSLYDLETYRLWRQVSSGQYVRPSRAIYERFGAEWAIADLSKRGFLEQAAADPGMREVFRGGEAVVFQVARSASGG